MLTNLQRYFRVLGVKGVLAAFEGKISKRPKSLALHTPASKAPIFLRVPSSDVEAYEQVFLNEEYLFDVTREPRFIIDAGANIGLTSVYFARKYPRALIVAIEPEGTNYRQLCDNTRDHPSVTCLHAALWGEDKQIQLVDPGLGHWGFMTAEAGAVASGVSAALPTGQSVQALSVETLIKRFAIDRIDIFKIDIEGAELELFSASAAWIDCVDSIIIELHDRLKDGCVAAFELATQKFEMQWGRGENVYKTRTGGIVREVATAAH